MPTWSSRPTPPFEATGGEFAFGCVTGAFAGGSAHTAVEFDWYGDDGMDEACGSNWAELQADGSLYGGMAFSAGDKNSLRRPSLAETFNSLVGDTANMPGICMKLG